MPCSDALIRLGWWLGWSLTQLVDLPGPTGQPHKPQPALAGASQPNELIEDIN